jgi:integrase
MRRPMGEHGHGTVAKLPDGRYRVAVTMPDGRRVWRRARTEREAERIRRQLVEARELDLDPSRQTLADFLRSWIAGLRGARNQRVRPRTLDHYEMIVERHIIPTLGAYSLARVDVRRIQAWLDADPLAARTVHHHHAVLRRALNVAVKQRLLAYNPASHVEIPEVDDDRSDPLTADEVRLLLETSKGTRLHALWRLALVTGLRQGELLGLAWDDVGTDAITVHTQLQRLPPEQGGDVNGWALTRPKAARKVDTIAIDADTAEVLAEHRVRQAAERTPAWRYFGLVFVTEAGAPYHPSVILKAFRAACATAGIRRRRFHDLRHTNNRLLKDAGVEADVRMARHGHNTQEMDRRYGGASSVADRDAAERLARVIAR